VFILKRKSSDGGAVTPTPPTQATDAELWVDRAVEPSPVRAFTPYVGKHRAEATES